jgi:uncharacterized membrane protein YhaH (DUF805 family)
VRRYEPTNAWEMENVMVSLLAGLLYLVSFGCWLVILIDAFRDEVWKGIVALLCGLYLLYYGFFEFEHEYKWAIVLLGLFGTGAATAMMRGLG